MVCNSNRSQLILNEPLFLCLTCVGAVSSVGMNITAFLNVQFTMFEFLIKTCILINGFL